MDANLFKSILAMDSYNRGYDASVQLSGTQIGNATILADSTSVFGAGVDQNVGFYAVAYTYSGETVISYRGTDEDITPLAKDVQYGFGVGAGDPRATQAQMAFAFYNDVATQLNGGTPVDPRTANISLTGHSMGGGFAGLVGAAYGKNGLLFDNMAFQLATINLEEHTDSSSPVYDANFKQLVYGSLTPWAVDLSNLTGVYVPGESLSLPYTPGNHSFQGIAEEEVELGPDVDGLSGVQLHSMATLIIAKYAETEVSSTDWQAAAQYFWPVMYDHSFAGSFSNYASAPGTLLTQEKYSDIVRQAIAYSAIDEGTRVFGDTGIRALYNDANELGKVLAGMAVSQAVVTHATDISKAFVNFGGLLALNQILMQNTYSTVNGVLALSEAVNNKTLTVNFTDMLWSAINGGTMPNMPGRAALVGSLYDETGAADSIRDATGRLLVDNTTNAIERVVFTTGESGTTNVQYTSPALNKATLVIGGTGIDTITGGIGNEVIFGGTGNDTIIGGAGNDIIAPGAGSDTVYGDATNQFAGINSDTLILSNFSGGVGFGLGGLIVNGVVKAPDTYYDMTNAANFGTFKGFENFIFGSGNDLIDLNSNSNYNNDTVMFFDAGGGNDTLTVKNFGNIVVTESSLFTDNKEVSNAEIIQSNTSSHSTFYSATNDIVILALGHEYKGTTSFWLNYSDYHQALTIDSIVGTVTDGTATDTFPFSTIIGSDHGDTVTMTSGHFLWSGHGNDTITVLPGNPIAPSSGRIYYSGGDDIITITHFLSGAGGLSANFGYLYLNPAVTPGMVSFNEQNIVITNSSATGKTYTFDLVITVTGQGTITVPNRTKVISYGPDMIAGTSDDTITGNTAPNVSLWDGRMYQVREFGYTLQTTAGPGMAITTNVTPYGDTLTGATNGGSGDDHMTGGGHGGSGNDTIIDVTSGANGGNGDDTITGLSGDNTLYGGFGNDTLSGMDGADTLYGESGEDDLFGGGGNDTIHGGDGNDEIDGGAGTNTLSGGLGNDIYTLAAVSSNTIDDLAGANSLVLALAQPDVLIALNGNVLQLSNSGGTFFTSLSDYRAFSSVTFSGGTVSMANLLIAYIPTISNDSLNYSSSAYAASLSLSFGNDTFTGSGLGDTVNGDDGNDNIDGGNGDDVIDGGAGNDTLVGGGGTDTLNYAGAFSGVTVNLATTSAQNTVGAGTDTASGFENLRGSAFNDTLTGTSGNNVIEGGLGNDTMNAQGGTDTLTYANASGAVTVSLAVATAQNTGAAGTDTISNFENLTGSAFNDTLTGSTAANTINGGDGDDIIEGGAGNDTLTGGNGSDTASYASAGSAVTVNLSVISGQNTVGAGTDTLSGIENLKGSAFNDTLTGDSNLNIIEGGAGNDTMNGQGGTDTLTYANAAAGVTVNLTTTSAQNTGGAGTDTISNFENLIGSAFNDTLTGNSSDNVIEGGAGNDTLNGNGGTDTLSYVSAASAVTMNLSTATAQNTGGAGTDTVSNFENLTGSAHNDTLTGDFLANTINGGGGDDVIEGGTGNDTLGGQGGIDTLSYASTASAVTVSLAIATLQNTFGAGSDVISDFENLTGSAFNDTLTGNAFANTITAGDGNDIVDGGEGNDILIGGNGTDRLTYASAVAGVAVNLATTAAQDTRNAGVDTLSGFENLTGSAFDDALTGDSAANVIDGGNGNDAVEGGDGNDTLTGGSGTDTLTYANAAAGVTVNLATTTAQNTVGAGTDTASGFENLRGSAFNDTLTGDGIANVIEGGAGNDTMNAQGGIDTLSYANASGAVTVSLALATAQNTGSAGTDTVSNFENLTGSAFNDVLTGSTAANTINGGDGDDVIEGGLGNDILTGGNGSDTASFASAGFGVGVTLELVGVGQNTGVGTDTLTGIENLRGSNWNDTLVGNGGANIIEGGAGDDALYGQGGIDTLSYVSAASAVTVNLSTTTAQNTGGAGTDTVSSFENLTGSAFNDTLTGDGNANNIKGGDGNDTISGGGGNDILYGSGGTDTITGSTGGDIFVFENASAFSNVDTIADFNAGAGDKFDFHDIIDGLFDPVQNAINEFVDVRDSGGNTIVSIDRDGTGATYGFVDVATLTGVTGLDETTLYNNGNILAA